MSKSENGWEPSHAGADILEWRTVPGTNPPVKLQVMKGWPSAVLIAYAADYNAYIEPLRDPDSASFTPTNSVATSNHLNGTAMDLNWNSHPFQVNYAGFDDAKIQRMRELLKFYNYKGVQIVFWAQDWNSPKDAMHHQMGYNTWNNPVTGEFVDRFIRADGFSTYKRGGSAAPPVAPGIDLVKLVADAMGNVAGVDYAALTPFVRTCLRRSNCTTNNQIAMWFAQMGHESVSLKYMKEIWGPTAAQLTYQGRMGNNNPGDGERYMGRGPIQVTGKDNYRNLSQWAHDKGYVPTPTFFVDDPAALERYEYAFLGAEWYWTVAQPRCNELSDAGDVERVSKLINMPAFVDRADKRANGIQDRTDRWNRTKQMNLLPLLGDEGDDELSAEAERMIRELYDEYKSNRRAPSRSFFAKDQNWGETPLGFQWNMDGNINELYMTAGYLFGVTSIEADVEYIATYGVAPASWAGSISDDAGKHWLAEVGQQWCQGLISFRAAMQQAFQPQSITTKALDMAPQPQVVNNYQPPTVDNSRELADAQAEIARLREENVRLQTPPTTEVATLESGPRTSGERVGQLIDSVEDWTELALSMDVKQRAALSASIKVLEIEQGK